jgi:hypothetical protein
MLQKKIGDNFYYVVEAVLDAKVKSLHIISAYISKKDTFPDALLSNDPKRYVHNEHQSNVSKHNIHNPDGNVEHSIGLAKDAVFKPDKVAKDLVAKYGDSTLNNEVLQEELQKVMSAVERNWLCC